MNNLAFSAARSKFRGKWW